MRWSLALLCLLSWSAEAGTIYLCRSYGDGAFWSSKHCHAHNALLDRTVTVPDGLPWDQQVRLGEQARANGARLANPPQQQQPQRRVTTQAPQRPSNQSECRSLDTRAAQLDAMARRPQTGQMQDWISSQKRAVRSRQMDLRC